MGRAGCRYTNGHLQTGGAALRTAQRENSFRFERTRGVGRRNDAPDDSAEGAADPKQPRQATMGIQTFAASCKNQPPKSKTGNRQRPRLDCDEVPRKGSRSPL